MPYRYFEDFPAGTVIELRPVTVSAGEIVEFAEQFDPAPFHLSEEGAKSSMFGRLFASGWHTCAIAMRMMCDAFLVDSASQGGPGLDECRWLAPVFAGDTLSGRVTVTSARRSASRPGLGIVHFTVEIFKSDGTPVMRSENSGMYRTREADAA